MSPAKAKPFYASLVEKFQRSYSADSVKGNKYVFYN
jgi:D-aminoacyl-tRNA deacylase